MRPMSRDAVIGDYMQQLERSAAVLPERQRAELVAEIREHIDAAVAAAGDDEAAVRTLLDRLGTPEEIVAAAAEAEPQIPVRKRPSLELAAALLMTLGSLVMPFGWLAGVTCLWLSRRWRTWEKVLGTLVVPLGPFGFLMLVGFLPFFISTGSSCETQVTAVELGSAPLPGGAATTCTGGGSDWQSWLWIAGLLVVFVAAVTVPNWLYRRARRRADAEPASRPVMHAVC